jgi:hypothetical protein
MSSGSPPGNLKTLGWLARVVWAVRDRIARCHLESTYTQCFFPALRPRVFVDQSRPHKSCGTLLYYDIIVIMMLSITYPARILLYIPGVQTYNKLLQCEHLECLFDLFTIQSLVVYCLTVSPGLPHGVSAKRGPTLFRSLIRLLLPRLRRLPRVTPGRTRRSRGA